MGEALQVGGACAGGFFEAHDGVEAEVRGEAVGDVADLFLRVVVEGEAPATGALPGHGDRCAVVVVTGVRQLGRRCWWCRLIDRSRSLPRRVKETDARQAVYIRLY